MDNTTNMEKTISGINFEIVFYFEEGYISSDPFEPSQPSYIEISDINIADYPAVKIPHSIFRDIMENEDNLCEEMEEKSREDF